MAHFARLENNQVVQVVVVANQELLDNGVESEAKGIAFLQSLFPGTVWVQTSYNGNFRKKYAAVGDVYDAVRNAFIGPSPFPSWALDENTCLWVPPTPMPIDGNPYTWDEGNGVWVEVPAQRF